MSDSILTSTKKVLGIETEYAAFDIDILMHINSVFSTLAQLGIGPLNGFMIDDAEPTWVDFLGEDFNLNPVKTYVFLRIRMLFDPPTTPFLMSSMKEQIQEIEWRLNSHRESTQWVDPTPLPPLDDDPLADIVLDGGIG